MNSGSLDAAHPSSHARMAAGRRTGRTCRSTGDPPARSRRARRPTARPVRLGVERTDPHEPSLERAALGRTSRAGVHRLADREVLVHAGSLARRLRADPRGRRRRGREGRGGGGGGGGGGRGGGDGGWVASPGDPRLSGRRRPVATIPSDEDPRCVRCLGPGVGPARGSATIPWAPDLPSDDAMTRPGDLERCDRPQAGPHRAGARMRTSWSAPCASRASTTCACPCGAAGTGSPATRSRRRPDDRPVR